MKNLKKIFAVLLAFLLVFVLSSENIAYAATVKLNKTKVEIRTGSTYTLKLSGATGTVKWASSKASVAKVSSKGKVTAVKAGKATITATYKSKKYKCAVTVKSSKKVDIIFNVPVIEGTTAEDYVDTYKEFIPEALDLKVDGDNHIIATMYETDRKDYISEYEEEFDQSDIIEEAVADEYNGVFTKFKVDKLFQKIEFYADKDKYDSSYIEYYELLLGIASDYIQALYLVDAEDRTCTIIIYDDSTGDVLYTTAEESNE